jgi:hypothetical protein
LGGYGFGGDGMGGDGLGGDGMGGVGLGVMGGAGPLWKHFSQRIFMHSIFSLLSISGYTKGGA